MLPSNFFSSCFFVFIVGLLASGQLYSISLDKMAFEAKTEVYSTDSQVNSTELEGMFLAEIPELPTEETHEEGKKQEKHSFDSNAIEASFQSFSVIRLLRLPSTISEVLAHDRRGLVALYILFHAWKGFLS